MIRLPDFRVGQKFSDLSAASMRGIVDRLRKLDNISVGPGLELTNTPFGINIRLSPQKTQAQFQIEKLVIEPFQLYKVRRDYLVCVPPDTVSVTEETSKIYIARPYLLRRTPFDQHKRQGISYDYSGLDPRSTAIPQLRIFEEDHVTRLAERPGLGRDGVGTMLKEREVQTIMPIYYLADDPALEDDVSPDIIFAVDLGTEIIAMKTEAPDLTIINDVPTPIDISWLDLNLDGRAWQAVFVEAIHSTMVGL